MIFMRLRFKSILIFIFILFITCASIGIGYIFYDKIIDKSDIVVDGDLTINYMNGDIFNLKGNSTISFSITNNSNELSENYIEEENEKPYNYLEQMILENRNNNSENKRPEKVTFKISGLTKNGTIDVTKNVSSENAIDENTSRSELLIRKNRSGPTATVDLIFKLQTSTFLNFINREES